MIEDKLIIMETFFRPIKKNHVALYAEFQENNIGNECLPVKIMQKKL